jgi:hypothetical protein
LDNIWEALGIDERGEDEMFLLNEDMLTQRIVEAQVLTND